VYSGYNVSLVYDIENGGTTLCQATVSIMGSETTCATKEDAESFGCVIINDSSYTDDQLVPQAEVTRLPGISVFFNANYLSVKESGKYVAR
jgi:hypothetical protein